MQTKQSHYVSLEIRQTNMDIQKDSVQWILKFGWVVSEKKDHTCIKNNQSRSFKDKALINNNKQIVDKMKNITMWDHSTHLV